MCMSEGRGFGLPRDKIFETGMLTEEGLRVQYSTTNPPIA